MAGRILILKFAGRCGECHAALHPGDRARWYPGGKVYGLDCHDQRPRAPRGTRGSSRYTGPRWDGEPLGQQLSRLDPTGAYSPDGHLIGRTSCGHLDYPCCGC